VIDATGRAEVERVKSGPRTAADIEADIERARQQLAATLDQIAERVAPKNVAKRGLVRTREQFVYTDGTPRTERIIIMATVAGLFIGFMIYRRTH
jgi:hypothetical protein